MSAEPLKPCECGYGVRLVFRELFDPAYYVICDICGLYTDDADSRTEAIELWNTRTEASDD